MLFAPIREAFLPDQRASPRLRPRVISDRVAPPHPAPGRARRCLTNLSQPSPPTIGGRGNGEGGCSGLNRISLIRSPRQGERCIEQPPHGLKTRWTSLPGFQLFRRQRLEKLGSDRQLSLQRTKDALGFRAIGTSLATGFRPRAMTIFSPASARAISCDR